MLITDLAKIIVKVIDSKTLGRTIAQVWDLRGLSRDLAQVLGERIVKQKDIVVEALAREFSDFLARVNVSEEARKILQGMSLNITASVNFNDRSLLSRKISVTPARASKKKSLKRHS